MKKLIALSLIISIYSCSSDPEPVNPPAAPVATAATDITHEQFTANWNSSAGANDYELDVATDNAFANIVDSEKNLAGSTFVSSLNSNSEYFYRVRATINGANASGNSNTISVTTMPEAPLALAATDHTSSGFAANWQAVSGITNYLLYVSKDNFPANPANNVAGYDGKEVTGISHAVTGLDAGTIYYYVLKAKSATGESVESNSILTETSN
jgi:hypothetical protein